jgi:hypothetical protein
MARSNVDYLNLKCIVVPNSRTYRHFLFCMLCLSCISTIELKAQPENLFPVVKPVAFYPLLQNGNLNVSVMNTGKESVMRKPSISGLNNFLDHLSFFCKLEVKTDRKANMPVRVRLGSVNYVDRLEMKIPGALYAKPGQTNYQHRPSVPQ